MAYKFQKGLFRASGAVDIADDLDSEAGVVKGSDISATTLTLDKSSAAAVDIAGSEGIILSDVSGAHGVVIRGTTGNNGGEQFMINELVDGSRVGANMQFGSGSNTNCVQLKKTDGSEGIFGLEVRDASSTVQFKANYAAGKGRVSGSGDFQFADALTAVGNVTVGGDLTIDGTNITFFSTTVNVSGEEVFINKDESTDLNLRNVTRLDSANSGDQLQIRFETQAHDSDDTAVKRLKFYDANQSSLATLAAPKFFGDGSNLTGINADSFQHSVASRSDGDTLAVGMNYFTNTNSGVSGTLPSVSDGAVVYVKSWDNATSTSNYLQIDPDGSDTIEGSSDSIQIHSAYGAVKLIGSGSNWHLA